VTAVIAAQAALDRLDWQAPGGTPVDTLDPRTMLPQVAQGALAVECRADDTGTLAVLAAIDDPAVRRVVECERAFLAELGGGCTLPVGAHAVPAGDRSAPDALVLTGMLAGADGHVVLRHEATGTDGPALGRAVARYLLDDAGGADLGPWRPES
jgi:hydroxymethylbilane synthase